MKKSNINNELDKKKTYIIDENKALNNIFNINKNL
jgi:hypothetical protein